VFASKKRGKTMTIFEAKWWKKRGRGLKKGAGIVGKIIDKEARIATKLLVPGGARKLVKKGAKQIGKGVSIVEHSVKKIPGVGRAYTVIEPISPLKGVKNITKAVSGKKTLSKALVDASIVGQEKGYASVGKRAGKAITGKKAPAKKKAIRKASAKNPKRGARR